MRPDNAATPVETLRRSAAAWARLPPRWHLLGVLALVVIALLRYPFLTSPSALGDEGLYLQAFEVCRAGGTPYDVDGFFYPQVFARAGAWLLGAIGTGGTLAALRAANLCGLALAFWLATAWLPAPIIRRWLAAAALLCLSPAVHAGLDLGNVSFFIVGLTLAALFAWPRRPLSAGALLGAGLALKPIAAAAIPILAIHRPPWPGRRHLLAAATAAVTAIALLLPISGLRELLGQQMVPLAYARSFSLERLLALLGTEVDQVVLSAIVTALALAAARWRPTSSVRLLCLTVAAISLVTPLVWNHTLIVALPVQALALALAWKRRSGDATSALRRAEPIFVALGVAMMHAGTAAGIDDLAPPAQAALLLAVGLTPAALCAYAFALTATLDVPGRDQAGSRQPGAPQPAGTASGAAGDSRAIDGIS